jgi:hypothetical protein
MATVVEITIKEFERHVYRKKMDDIRVVAEGRTPARTLAKLRLCRFMDHRVHQPGHL